MEMLNTKTFELFDTSERFRDSLRQETSAKVDHEQRVGDERLKNLHLEAPLKVTYFSDARGRNELICLILAISKIPFEDGLFNVAEYKKKASTLPFGQLPTITIEKTSGTAETYGQSTAIARYAAKLGGMYPENDLEAALLQDSVVDSWRDMLDRFYATVFYYDVVEGKLQMVMHSRSCRYGLLQKYLKYDLEPMLMRYNRMLSTSGHRLDNALSTELPSFSDLAMFDLCKTMHRVLPRTQLYAMMKKYPLLQKLIDRIEELEMIKVPKLIKIPSKYYFLR